MYLNTFLTISLLQIEKLKMAKKAPIMLQTKFFSHFNDAYNYKLYRKTVMNQFNKSSSTNKA